MPGTRSRARSIRDASTTPGVRVASRPGWPFAPGSPTIDAIGAQLHRLKERAGVIEARLQNLDVALQLLDRIAHDAEQGNGSPLGTTRSKPDRVTLLRVSSSVLVTHD